MYVAAAASHYLAGEVCRGQRRAHLVFSFSPTSAPTGGKAMILHAYSFPFFLSRTSFTTEKPVCGGGGVVCVLCVCVCVCV